MIYAVRYCLIGLYTVFWGTLACILCPFDPGARIGSWIGRRWISWIFRTCGIRIEAEGLEGIDPSQPTVFMCNHQSVVDIGALVLTLPGPFRFVAKKELMWIPFFGWALALSIGILVERGNRQRAIASLKRAAQKVRSGAHVIIFPEGTRSPGGEIRPFKSGGFHLALQAQVPIVPVTVSGSRRITPKGSLRVESGTVKIVYGKTIPTRGLTVDDRETLKEVVRAAIVAGFDPALERVA